MASRPSRKTDQTRQKTSSGGKTGRHFILIRLLDYIRKWWADRRENPLSWLEKSQNRLIYLGMGFLFLYGGVAVKALFADRKSVV